MFENLEQLLKLIAIFYFVGGMVSGLLIWFLIIKPLIA